MKITDGAVEGFRISNTEQSLFHGHRKQKVWLLIADREKASIYNINKTAGPKVYRKKTRSLDKDSQNGQNLELIVKAISDITPMAAGVQKNKGHITATEGSVSYGSDPRDRENHQDEKIFIRDLSEWLDRAEKEHAFDKIVIAAAPRTQGNLREYITPNVKKRILTTLSKDLTYFTPAQIKEYLDTDLDIPPT